MSSSKKSISRKVKGRVSSYDTLGLPHTTQTVRGPAQIAQAKTDLSNRREVIIQASTSAEREAFDNLPDDHADWHDEPGPVPSLKELHTRNLETMQTIEAQRDAVSNLKRQVYKHYHHQVVDKRRVDYRTRRDRVERRNASWAAMYPKLIDAYLEWDCEGPPMDNNDVARHPPIVAIDTFNRHEPALPLNRDESFNVTLARHGYIGNAPLHPSCGFSMTTLELYRIVNSRCPQLTIQGFVRSLCDIQRVTYKPTLRTHFSIAFDTYIEVLVMVQHRVNSELGRSAPDWRLRNACPPCTYILEDEPSLKYSMLVALDGNNSLKRVERGSRDKDDTGKTVITQSTELPEGRELVNDMYLTEREVDHFKDEVKRRLPPVDASPEEIVRLAATGEGGRPIDGVDESTPCVDRWSNLADDATKKMWGIFRETGIFVAVCRHGTMLVMCDMIKSGELAKYPLAIINRLIDVFGPDILAGYDIGCGFSTTANKSTLLGPKLREKRCRFCVGSFHGHAHCRMCQLDWHPLYITGAGLEDFETCERCFSASNAVAIGTRHASIFHRRQAILRHFTCWNADKYAELSRFLYNNYVQALDNITVLSGPLEATKKALGIPSDETFEAWRQEEKTYLASLKHEPEADLLQMEYLRTLKLLLEADTKWRITSKQWMATPASELQRADFYSRDGMQTRNLETARSEGLDRLLTLQQAVEQLESKLEINMRWTPESDMWKQTETLIVERTYRLALDKLEGLVVARLFELTKLNHSGTGRSYFLHPRYKLRTHIAKALKARSKAIRTAVTKYNAAASSLSPPRPELDLQSVLDYVFLAQFDLLRDSRYQIHDKPWTRAAEREALVNYFKIQRSREEIKRLNVEVRRLATWISDEEHHFNTHLERLRQEAPQLAHQLAKIRQTRRAVNENHGRWIGYIQGLEGFTGWTQEGVWQGLSTSAGEQGSRASLVLEQLLTTLEDVDEESDGEGEEGAVDALNETILSRSD